jgi:ubiquinone/menaquinone biosynthesis C-methylase UbiE
MKTWNGQQIPYWDRVSGIYDSLYVSPWCDLENQLAESIVRRTVEPTLVDDCPKVADFGCGTGYGAALMGRLAPNTLYTGIDISSAMLAIAAKRVELPNARFIQASMEDVPALESNSQDIVLCLFTALSFSNHPDRAIAEFARVLKPDGLCVLSCLSRYCLRRLIQANFSSVAPYATRNDVGTDAPSSHFLSAKQLRNLVCRVGLSVGETVGISALGGLFEWTPLWNLDRALCNSRHDLGHMIFLSARKQDTL